MRGALIGRLGSQPWMVMAYDLWVDFQRMHEGSATRSAMSRSSPHLEVEVLPRSKSRACVLAPRTVEGGRVGPARLDTMKSAGAI